MEKGALSVCVCVDGRRVRIVHVCTFNMAHRKHILDGMCNGIDGVDGLAFW